MKTIHISAATIFMAMCVLLIGCPGNNSGDPQSDPQPNETQNNQNNQSDLDLGIQDEAPLPVSALSQLPTVQETLEKTIGAYKNLNSYTDQAYCKASIRRGGEVSNQSSPFFFSFIKPNKLRYVSRTCEIRADGKTISVFIPSLPGVILQKPCPKELHLEDILFDQSIDEAVFVSQPSKFSVLPLQWIMLFADDPLKTLTFGQKEIRVLSPLEIKGRPCYRLRIDREDGTTTILWIEQKTGLILRAQLPPNAVEDSSIDDVSITIEFESQQINVPVPDAAFAIEIPVGTNVTETYLPQTTQLLGTKAPDFQFNKLDNAGSVDSSAVKDKITIINFWTTWTKQQPSIVQQLNQLRQQYKDDREVAFLSVSIDEASVSDAALRDALKQWDAPLDCVRDNNGYLSEELKINMVPVIFVLNKNGIIESAEMGFNPLLVNDISNCIDEIKNGKSPYKQTLENKLSEIRQYEQRRKEWLERGAFVDADVIEQTGIPETKPAQISQPRQFELKPLWETTDIQNPGGLIAEDSQDNGDGKVWVIENGKKVVQIDSNGRIKSRIDLGLNSKEICSFIRKSAATKPEDVRFLAFAPGQQRIHVYDKNWKNLFHYPGAALDNSSDGIQDARFGNLINNDDDEIYIGYLGTSGAQGISLDGSVLWSNRTLGTVYSIAPYQSQNDNLLLCCASSSGTITVLTKDGKTMGDQNNIGVITLKDNQAAMVYSAKLQKETDPQTSVNDSLCALCPNQNQNSYTLVGFNIRSEILWTYELPQGIPKRPIDYLTSANVLPNGENGNSIWIALGSDGSIHFIDEDGILIDSFNHGQFVYGLTVANWNGQPVLILSDEQGIKAYQIIWK